MIDFIGNSKKIVAVREMLEEIAKSNDNVLLLGESGTGKEVAARFILEHSCRKNEPYLPVNCAGIARTLLESQLFGYESGAFTGANKCGHKGFLESADNGTLFLDEIGKIEKQGGADFLRVIEYGDYIKVGGNQILHSNVRILAADSQLKSISEELFYRFPEHVVIPPLRERAGDIPLLTNYFWGKLNENSDHPKGLPDEVVEKYNKYSWPGNVRQLKNSVNFFYRHNEIDFREYPKIKKDDMLNLETEWDWNEAILSFKKNLLIRALEKTKGDKTKAADLLNMSMYNLNYHLKKLPKKI